MATPTRFKGRGRQPRIVFAEDTYQKGCFHTNKILPTGHVRTLVNFNLEAEAAALRPRDGIKTLGDPILLREGGSLVPPHATFYGVVTDKEGTEHFADITVGFGSEVGGHYSAADSWVIFTPPWSETPVQPDWTMATNKSIKASNYSNLVMHGMEVPSLSKPLYEVFGGRLYALVMEPNGPFRLSVLRLTETPAGVWQAYFNTVTPKQPGLAEAVGTGFNMLSDTPYNFDNSELGYLDLKGVVPYTPDKEFIQLSANPGEEVLFELYYSYKEAQEYRLKWQYRAVGSDAWETLIDWEDKVITGGDTIQHSFVPEHERFSMRILMAPRDDTLENKIDTTFLNSYPYPLYTVGNEHINKNGQIKFDLGTAKGMATNGTSLILYGVEGAENTLFFSDFNAPEYFPFPYYTDELDEEILGVHSYLGMLLVVTSNSLMLLNGGPLPIEMQRVPLQENLGISRFERHSIKIIRNLIFYKANDYYYIMAPSPKAAKPNDMVVAPISRPIQDLLNRMQFDIERNLNFLYGAGVVSDVVRPDLKDYYNYIEGERVHNVYLFHLGDRKFEYSMVYDTVARTWHYEVVEVNHLRVPYRKSTSHNMVFYGSYLNGGNLYAHMLQARANEKQDDFFLMAGDRLMKNYQFMDTGSRDHGEYHKKRYREIQYIINNRGQEALWFHTAARLDGQERRGYTRFESRHITDPASPDYGLIYYERIEESQGEVGGQTALDIWELDTSMFPNLDKVKIRFKISGKGYYPRLLFVSRNEKDYELLSNAWVFRAMNAR